MIVCINNNIIIIIGTDKEGGKHDDINKRTTLMTYIVKFVYLYRFAGRYGHTRVWRDYRPG